MTAEAEVIAPETPETGKKSRSRNGAKSELPGTLVEVAPKDLVIEPRREGVDINMLMAHAVQTGNIDTMERVMAIRRELKAEAAKEAFFAALSAFQQECPVIKRKKPVYEKDRQKGVRYYYAPMDDIVRIVSPLLTKHGLSYSIVSKVEKSDGDQWLLATCTVHHDLGHNEESEFRVPLMFSDFMNRQQSFGSASTFAKRYAFCNALGILTGDDDNDARSNGISPNEARAARQPVSQPRETPTAQRAAATKAANGETKEKAQLEPAGEGEGIDANTIKGLSAAMEHARLGQEDFQKRFSGLNGLEQVKKTDSRVVMSWIADPTKN